jgi:hypothetical protein
MNILKEFILELQTNFGPHKPVRDVEHDLDHLLLKDGQRITKYIYDCGTQALYGLWSHRTHH